MTPPTVLLVDDEPAIRLALSKWFERQGWSVLQADCGDTAADHLRSANTALDLIVCDVQLPGVSGLELASMVEEHWPALLDRFVFTTGAYVDFSAEQQQLQDRTRVLLKPFDFGTLLNTVRQVVPLGESAA